MQTEKPWDLSERSFVFAIEIVRLCRRLDATTGIPRRLSGQLFGSGTAIGSNVHEGQAAQTRADFVTKYTIALKEANETVYWLRLLIATKLLADARIEAMLQEARELANIIGRCIVTARKNDPKPRRVR